jgi:hypothetical protein
VFAVHDREPGTPVYRAFAEILAGKEQHGSFG